MDCYIYRCSRKPDMYIYLAEEDDFSTVPKEIFNSLGIVSFAMKLEINSKIKLAKEDSAVVIANLKEHGFHLQLPDQIPTEELMARIANKNT